MDLKNVLKILGLEEKEAKAYLALLKADEATATKIAVSTGIDRTLTYQIMNKLIERGLASYVIKNNVRFFSPANPEKLMQDLLEKKKELSSAMPELLSISRSREEETKVEIYRGKEGLKTVLKDILRTGEDYIAFGEEGRFQLALPIYSRQFLRQIEKMNIHERVLARKGAKVLKAKTSRFKYVSEDAISPATVVVYGNKSVTLVWTKPYYAILTENKEIADSYRSFFRLLWNKTR